MHSNIVYFAYREIDLNTICVYKKIKSLLKRRGGYTVKKEAARCVLTNVPIRTEAIASSRCFPAELGNMP